MYNKKSIQNIIFQARGGELISWAKTRGKNKGQVKLSIFMGTEFNSKKGGICYQLITDGKKHTVALEDIELYDVKADYLNDKGELI